MFDTFGGNSVSPGQVSYASLSLTASISLAWPNFAGEGTNAYALVMDLTANAGGYSITFPDARQAGNGTTALLRNTGAQTITILANDGSTITTIAAGIAKFLYLQSNATLAGTWGIVTFGAGTSAADASALAGYGLQAIGLTLNQAHPTVALSTAITVTAQTDLAKVYVATGGSVAATFPTSASAGSNFFVIVKNDGSGTVTLTPSGGDTIDNAANVALAPNDSCIVCSLGNLNGWVTIGLGRAVSFAFTQLVKSVAGAADVTLTAAECANKLITLTGVLTGNINVIVTNTVSVYYVFNNTTGAFTVTLKTAAGTGLQIAQGTHDVGVCDGTNVYRAITNTASATAFIAGSAASPSITFISNTSTGFYLPSTGVAGVSASSFEVMSWNSQAASVNWTDVFATATGVSPYLQANGSDGNIGYDLKMKGVTGSIRHVDGSGNLMGTWLSVASAVNYLEHAAKATGTNPTITAKGDTNTGIRLVAKGTGKIQLTDGTDTTKVAQFDESGISTGTTRTVTLPDSDTKIPIIGQVLTITGPTAPRSYAIADSSVTIADTSTTQTLTNKTLTSPKMTVQTLAAGATVAVDMSLGTAMILTLGAAANAIQNPTNLAAGQWGWITIKQDGTGGRTCSWGTAYKFVGGVAVVSAATGLSNAASAVDRAYWVCDDGVTVQITWGKGFA